MHILGYVALLGLKASNSRFLLNANFNKNDGKLPKKVNSTVIIVKNSLENKCYKLGMANHRIIFIYHKVVNNVY